MGDLEFAIHSISQIIGKKFKDEKLAEEIRMIASECHYGEVRMKGENGTSPDHPNNKKIIQITNTWRKKYKEYL